MRDNVLSNLLRPCLIHDTKQGDQILVFLLSDEFGDDTNIRERALSVRKSHDALHEVDLANLARVVVPYPPIPIP